MGRVSKTDAELVEASRRGERDAFGDLVNRYQDVVCAVSYSSTGNWALSEDVAQDTFIAAWRQLGQLRETSRIRSWLCGIARNLARKARKRTDREAAVDDDMPATDVNPFDATAQAEVDRVVREALARIPDTYRETLVLYYCENRSIAEVASALGIAEAAAMQRLTRGRRYLANGVTDLVERSLRGTRPRKNLSAAVLAALPLGLPSRVDASPTEGSTMLKIGIAIAVAAATGTAAFVVHHVSQADPPAAAPAHIAAALPVEKAPVAPSPSVAPQIAQPLPPKPAHKHDTALPYDTDDEEKIISKQTMQQLGIEQGPSRGPANAPVTIVVYQDLQCAFCAKVLGTIDQLWDEYPTKLRLVVKQFPVHGTAILAAEASLAAHAQGKFWELHDLMMANQDALDRDALIGYAQQAGMDVAAFTSAIDNHTYKAAMQAEADAGKQIGVQGTPHFLINGKEFVGARGIEEFRGAIDAALAGN